MLQRIGFLASLRHRRQISAPARRQTCRLKQKLGARSTLRLGSLNVERALSIVAIAVFAASPGFAADLAVDASGCLEVSVAGPSATCDAKAKSLKVELKNTCKRPVRAQICMRGASHLWVNCSTNDNLATGEKFFGSTCDSDGDYTYWGCSQISGNGSCGGADLVGKATNVPKK
jgi:hypothetical protein